MSERASTRPEDNKVSRRRKGVVAAAVAGVALGIASFANASGSSACNPEIGNCTPGTTIPGQESTSTTGLNDKGTTTSESTTTTEGEVTTSTQPTTTTEAPTTTSEDIATTTTITVPGTSTTVTVETVPPAAPPVTVERQMPEAPAGPTS